MPTYLEDIAGITMKNASDKQLDSSCNINTTAKNILSLEQTERIAIEQAIKKCNGNVSKAANALGVSPSTIYRKMKLWDQGDH